MPVTAGLGSENTNASAAAGTAGARGASVPQRAGRRGIGEAVPAETGNVGVGGNPAFEMRILVEAMQAQFQAQQETQRQHGAALEELVKVLAGSQRLGTAQGNAAPNTAPEPSGSASAVSVDVGDKRAITEKSFRRVDKFQAGETAFAEWRDDMMNCMRAAHQGYANLPDVHCINGAKPQDIKLALMSESPEMRTRDAEFAQILRMLTTGEAKALIRDQDTGMGAWQMLQSVFARHTLARALRLHREILSPGQAKTAADIISMSNTWWSRVQALERDLGKLPILIKIAGLTEICTSDLRTQIYARNMDLSQLTDTTLDDLRQFVLRYAACESGGKLAIWAPRGTCKRSDS